MEPLAPTVDQVAAEPGMAVAGKAIYHQDPAPQVRATEAAIQTMSAGLLLLMEALAEPEVVAPVVLEQTVLIQILAPVVQERNGLMAITMLVEVAADFVVAVEPTEA
jgi:hypothetical protein